MIRIRHRRGDFALDVDFSIDAGITALFGPSGSGKSTILAILAGLITPDDARIDLDGTVLADSASGIFVKSHKRRIGVVFQDSLLFPHLSVRGNLGFGRRKKDGPTIDFDAVIDTLGIGHLLDRRPSTLSGGERQRVAIGRALLSAPRLLMMDEPLAALDHARRIEILPLIERVASEFGIPILYVSHAVEEVARLAQQVVLLDRGKVTATGAPEEVFGRMHHDGDRFAMVSVLAGTLGEPEYGLTPVRHPSGTLWLSGTVGRPGNSARVVLRATDIALSLKAPEGLTIRTALAGEIFAINARSGPVAEITVALTGGDRIVASVTQKAIADLDLAPGRSVHVLVKSVAMDERAMAGG